MSETEIRPFAGAAAAGPEDLRIAARLMRRSFAGHANARLGERYARAWMGSFSRRDGWLALAQRGGGAVGFATGVTEGSLAARYREIRGVAAIALGVRPWLWIRHDLMTMAARRLLLIAGAGRDDGTAAAEATQPAIWYLPLIGVAPEACGAGVGRALLASFEAEGRRRGLSRAALHVRTNNLTAVRLYEGLGWRRMDEDAKRRRYEKELV